MERGLLPFSAVSYEESGHIQSHISFQDDSNVFSMRTWIRKDGDTALEYVRRYGWSIVYYDGEFQTDVSSSDILSSFDDTKIPQFESFRIRSRWEDVEDVEQIIQRSPNFKDLGMYVNLSCEDEFEAAQTLLSRHSQIPSVLNLVNGEFYKERWSWFASSFPTRESLPALESLRLGVLFSDTCFDLPSDCIQWIVPMVSAPPPQELISPSRSRPTNQDIIENQVSHAESVKRGTWTLLKKIELDHLKLQTKEWKSVIEAIDFSELQILSFSRSNLSLEELQLLVDRIPDNPSIVPLKTLDITYTPAAGNSASRSLVDTLGRKAQLVKIRPDYS
ncbi:hypothetical protein B0O80DRAFT_171041 [Mortierella sp. GBAus27b]|nr:hypothetical protein B0O80DRAFT_171041 [Mortierella sp. GBAus27b]